MPKNKHSFFIFDFDSTFIQVEAMELLCSIVLRAHPSRDRIFEKIKEITKKGMLGKLPIGDSLTQRISLMKIHRQHLTSLTEQLQQKVSVSIQRNKVFFNQRKEQIYIVSNGFEEFILPIVQEFGIQKDHVFCNNFIFDEAGYITGANESNPLFQEDGKVQVIKNLNLAGKVIVIGDGWNDFAIRKAGFANQFYAFTENTRRKEVVEVSDAEAPSFDEILYTEKLPMTISFPKNRIKVLLLENIHSNAVNFFSQEGYAVESIPSSLSSAELKEKIENVSVLGIRSKTKITKEILQSAKKLMCIGAFCKGTNQIDLGACLQRGTVVFNAPYSNTRSVVELAIAEIIFLIRNLTNKVYELKRGQWHKSARESHEIRGKKIGIVGYGNIGSQLSVLAEMLGMQVYFYDLVEKLPLGNAIKMQSLESLLATVDVVSIHVDGRKENDNLFDKTVLGYMRKGSILINLARGSIVDLNSLEKYLQSGHIRGAGLDVFPKEPMKNQANFSCPIASFPNVILTPHIGGSTQEAQADIADYVPKKIVEYINTGNTVQSVNFPEIRIPPRKNSHRLLHVHKNEPGILRQINTLVAQHNANILNQTLKTSGNIGYLITEIDKEYNSEMIQALKKIKCTIKFRVLY